MIIVHLIAKKLRTKFSFILQTKFTKKRPSTKKNRQVRVRGTVRMHARAHAQPRKHDKHAAFVMIAMSQDAHSAASFHNATAKWSQIRRNWSIGQEKPDLIGLREWTLRPIGSQVGLGRFPLTRVYFVRGCSKDKIGVGFITTFDKGNLYEEVGEFFLFILKKVFALKSFLFFQFVLIIMHLFILNSFLKIQLIFLTFPFIAPY